MRSIIYGIFGLHVVLCVVCVFGLLHSASAFGIAAFQCFSQTLILGGFLTWLHRSSPEITLTDAVSRISKDISQ